MAAIMPIFGAIGEAFGSIGAIGAGAGGLGGIGSALSLIGTVTSMFSSKDTASVPQPNPVQITPSQPLPDQTTPATLLTAADQATIDANEKKRRLLTSSRSSTVSQSLGDSTAATVGKNTLLGS
jgi:hypothetical protein